MGWLSDYAEAKNPDPTEVDLTLPSFLVRSPLMEKIAMAGPIIKDVTLEGSHVLTPLPEHSLLGASSNDRWLNCPGSVGLIRKLGLTSGSNEYAAEGTVAHELASMVLLRNRELWEFAGEVRKQDGFEIEVDDEMIAGVQLYVDLILAEPGMKSWVEYPAGLKNYHPNLWGTLDAAKLDGSVLRVYDFKYGMQSVEAENNTQLMQYAASLINGMHDDESGLIEEVEIVIVQPRAPHFLGPIRRWRIPITQLGEWLDVVLVPGAKKTDDPDAPLNFGSWCRWCPANSTKTCPKISERVGGIMNAAEKASTTSEDAKAFDDWEIAEQLDLKKAVMQHFALLEAEAFTRMMNGGHIPGQKLVRGITRRVWKEEAEAKLKEALGADAFTEPSLKSPAQVEKLGKAGKALSAELAFKPEGQLTMAPEDDRRPAETLRDVGSILNSV